MRHKERVACLADQVLQGHVLDVLKTIPSGVVQCCVTSPPYWGFRTYGLEPVIWDAARECQHVWGLGRKNIDARVHDGAAYRGQRREPNRTRVESGQFCEKCGGWLGVLGLEPSISMYIDHLVEVFAEVHRVLRSDGVMWVVMGDTHSGSWGYNSKTTESAGMRKKGFDQGAYPSYSVQSQPQLNLKPKDRCFIPIRLAIGLQEYGWWVREEIIWAKGLSLCPTYGGAVMPESCTDRPATSHEYILECTKSGDPLFWTHPRKRSTKVQPEPDYTWVGKRTGLVVSYPPVSSRLLKKLWKRVNLWHGHDYYYDNKAVKDPYTEAMNRWGGDRKKVSDQLQDGSPYAAAHRDRAMRPDPEGRNLRSIWVIPIEGSDQPHFAAFPKMLAAVCIRLTSSEKGCCPECGAPWVRIVQKGFREHQADTASAYPEATAAHRMALLRQAARKRGQEYQDETRTVSWRPSCCCGGRDRMPCLVLDPFMGSGTTAQAAAELSRSYLGIDLNPKYIELSRQKTQQLNLVLL